VQGRSLPPAWTLVTPYCKRTRPGRGTNTKAAGFPSHACLPPASLPPFALRLAPTHLGWGTRRQFTRRSRDPPGLKRRQVIILPQLKTIISATRCNNSIQTTRETPNLTLDESKLLEVSGKYFLSLTRVYIRLGSPNISKTTIN
jgi:hypothetical protein